MIRATHRFRHLLLGVEFLVVTDHQALKWLWSLCDPSGRLARWVLHLSQYDFSIEHRRGQDIPHVDALSRDASFEYDRCRAVQLRSGSTGADGPGDCQTGPDRGSVSVRRDPAAVADCADPGPAVVPAAAANRAARAPGSRGDRAPGPRAATRAPSARVDADEVAAPATSAVTMDFRDASAGDPVVGAVIRTLSSGEPCPSMNDEVRFYLSDGQLTYLRVSE